MWTTWWWYKEANVWTIPGSNVWMLFKNQCTYYSLITLEKYAAWGVILNRPKKWFYYRNKSLFLKPFWYNSLKYFYDPSIRRLFFWSFTFMTQAFEDCIFCLSFFGGEHPI